MREYVAGVRAILRGEEPPESELFPTKFAFMGYAARAELPIYVAALSPNMIRLAGEVADGVMLWLCCPGYIRDTVIPALREGVRGAGRIVRRLRRRRGGPVGAHRRPRGGAGDAAPGPDPLRVAAVLPRDARGSGFADELAAFDEGMAAGDLERAKAGLSDRMLGELAGIGSAADVQAAVAPLPRRRRQLARRSAGCPGTDFDAALESVAELI